MSDEQIFICVADLQPGHRLRGPDGTVINVIQVESSFPGRVNVFTDHLGVVTRYALGNGGTGMKSHLWGWMADEGGCGFYRIQAPLMIIDDAFDDIEVGTGVKMPSTFLQEEDLTIVIQRSTNPQAVWAMHQIRESGRKWIYDIDDLLWKLEPDNPAYQYYSEDEVRERLHWQVTEAPLTLTSTPNLAEEVIEYGGNPDTVKVYPNTLPQRVFDKVDKIQAEVKDQPFTIFWRGSPTHAKDVLILKYAVKRLRDRTDIRWVFAGADYRKEIGVDAELLPWVNSTEEYFYQVAELQPDVALCPLGPTRFNRSKSHVNALEASMIGALPICSDVPAYDEFIEHGMNGYLVGGNEDNWYKMLRDVIGMDRDVRDDIRYRAKQNARRFTTELWKDQYCDHLNSVA